MAIVSHDFGGLRLSGRDASVFVRQVETGRKNKRAAASVAAGRKMAAAFNKKGRVRVNVVRKARAQAKS